MTNNHDYNTPEQGAADWHVPINENFEQIDRDVEIRDKDSNKGSYEPKDGAKFFATDSGNVYLGDGSSWNPVSVGTSSDSPSFRSVDAKEAYVNAQQADAIVYQDGGETRAIGKNGVIDSGSNPSQVIQSAIQQGRYVEITGDYELSEEITVTQNNREIAAGSATFTATGDHKLWHFDEADYNRITIGGLDLGSDGRVGLDIHASMANHVSVRTGYVPAGTFTEDDGYATGTYNRCALRLKGKSGRGTFWNHIHAVRPWGTGEGNSSQGNGIEITGTEGNRVNPGNANLIHAAKLTDYDVGVNIDPGNGNTFFNLEVTACNTGLRTRPGRYGSVNDLFGFAWFEQCGTGIDIPAGQGGADDAHLQIVGKTSFAETNTNITNMDQIAWHDYVNRRQYYLADSGLANHKEGNTGSDPTSQSPSGWLEIEQHGSTKYVPYYD